MRRRRQERGYDRVPSPTLIGHRGTRTTRTENTIAAIEVAAADGAHGIEIDVRLCRSGEIIVMHDRTLARVTGDLDGRAVASMTLSAIREVRLPCGAPIPTLEEVLEVCAAHELLVNVEVKHDVPSPPRLALSVARLVRASRWAAHVVLSSFDPLIVTLLALLAPDVDRALLLEPDHRYLAPVARALRASAIHPAAELMTIANVERWHRWGMRVIPWTINDRGHSETLLSLGADGIITDTPATLRASFASARTASPTDRR